MRSFLFSLSCYVAACFTQLIFAEKLEYHSFSAPFPDVDHVGERIASRYWRESGSTIVYNNYIRLTPERQSKIGALWSRKPLGVPAFSSILKFRISGTANAFFGDGIAMWITQQGYFLEGGLHGSLENFVGVGIIFDTFRNTEMGTAHRDVTVIINDGEKTWDMMIEDIKGCNLNFRYHSERADFSVNAATRTKITLDNSSLVILVDAHDTGEWVTCVNLTSFVGYGLPKDWIETSHLGLTAATGQLADNHDIMSLASYSDFQVMEREEAEKDTRKQAPLFEPGVNLTETERLLRLENAIDSILRKYEFLDHHLEHELSGLRTSVKNLQHHVDDVIEKVDEISVAKHIEEVEKRGEYDELDESHSSHSHASDAHGGHGSLSEKLAKDHFTYRIAKLESRLEHIDTHGHNFVWSAWKVSFFGLLIMMVFGAAAFFGYYQQLMKKWKLP